MVEQPLLTTPLTVLHDRFEIVVPPVGALIAYVVLIGIFGFDAFPVHRNVVVAIGPALLVQPTQCMDQLMADDELIVPVVHASDPDFRPSCRSRTSCRRLQ